MAEQAAQPGVIHAYMGLGIALCLFGWTLYWTGMHVVGTSTGALAGMAAGLLSAELLNLPDQPAMITVGTGAALGGLAGAFLMRMIQKFFFFVTGAAMGAPLGWQMLLAEPVKHQPWAKEAWAAAAFVAGGALAGGLLCLVLKRYVMAVVTALVGACFIAFSIPSDNQTTIAAACFALSAAFQTGATRFVTGKKKKE